MARGFSRDPEKRRRQARGLAASNSTLARMLEEGWEPPEPPEAADPPPAVTPPAAPVAEVRGVPVRSRPSTPDPPTPDPEEPADEPEPEPGRAAPDPPAGGESAPRGFLGGWLAGS